MIIGILDFWRIAIEANKLISNKSTSFNFLQMAANEICVVVWIVLWFSRAKLSNLKTWNTLILFMSEPLHVRLILILVCSYYFFFISLATISSCWCFGMVLYAKSYAVCDFCERIKRVNILRALVAHSLEHFWGEEWKVEEVDSSLGSTKGLSTFWANVKRKRCFYFSGEKLKYR